jgi:hypothetical protein
MSISGQCINMVMERGYNEGKGKLKKGEMGGGRDIRVPIIAFWWWGIRLRTAFLHEESSFRCTFVLPACGTALRSCSCDGRGCCD